jgi:pantoate--beta-alanine ligase
MGDSRPELIRDIAGLRDRLAVARKAGSPIGFVPTMGALHAGHGALMDAAKRDCNFIAASIFVNPIQFNNKEDYEKYGRNLPADLDFCAAHQVDVVFAPGPEEMYSTEQDAFVEVLNVSNGLCGEFRPGHFRGVATVVTKLFNIVQPDISYFGEKDAQQLAVIRRMVQALNMNTQITGVPTVREPDGLALSSRNQRLTPEERAYAPILFQALDAARLKALGGCQSATEVRAAGLDFLSKEPRIRLEYFEIVDAEDMQPVTHISARICIAAAVWLGSVRLIDNIAVQPLIVSPGR